MMEKEMKNMSKNNTNKIDTDYVDESRILEVWKVILGIKSQNDD